MNGLNYDSAETLHKIYTLHKRVSVVILLVLVVIMVIQLFWVVLFFIFNHEMNKLGEGLQQSNKELRQSVHEGFKTLDQLNAERPVIPKKFD